jgi:hypothetical protein
VYKGIEPMPVTKKSKHVGVRWIARAEAKTIVDAKARSVLGISGDQFVAGWKSGKYRELDSDECPGVIELALLAPLPRHSSGRKKQKRSRR